MPKRNILQKVFSESKSSRYDPGRRTPINFGKWALVSCLILVFLITPVLSIQPVVAGTPPNLTITASTQTLIAGSDNQVTFTIRNIGEDTATQTFASLSLPSSAAGGSLMILNGSDGKWYINNLGSFDYYSIPANIYVSPSAAGGSYQLTFTLTYNYYGAKTETRTIGLNVPSLNVTGASIAASIAPYELVLGQNNVLTLKLKNIGDADATSVTASLVMPGAATGSSPLSLINSDGRWTYNAINKNDEVSIPLTIYASPSSAGQTYQAALSLTYSDYIKARADTKYLTLSVPFNTSPAVNFEIGLAPQDLKAGETNTLNITINNKGDSDATYVQAVLTMPPSTATGLPIVLQNSDGRWLIDKIKAGEQVKLQANVYVNPASAGTAYQSSVSLTYYDSLSRAKQDTRYFGLNVPSLNVTGASIAASIAPYELVLGQNNVLTLKLKNIGDADATSVTASLVMPGAATGSSPLSLINSDGRWTYNAINKNDEVSIPLTIYASPSSAGQTYQAALSLTYSDYIKARADTKYLTLSVPFNTSPAVNFEIGLAPQDLKAGETNTLNITINNKGDSDATYVQAVLTMPPSTATGLPIVLQNSDGRWLIDKIKAGEQVKLQANVYVNPASAGTAYQSSVSLTYYDSLSRAKQDTRYFGLNVPAVYAPTAVIDVGMSKTELKSGGNNYLNLTVKNDGDGVADSLAVYLSLPGVQGAAASLALIGSDGTWFLGRLAPGEERTIPLNIFATPAASGSVMSLTVTLSYTDMNYKVKQQTNYLGVIVRGNVDLVILGMSTYPPKITAGKAFSLTVDFINLGTATAQSVIVTPNGTGGVQPVSLDKVFLGDLPINVPSSFTLTYTAANVTSGTYGMSLEYSYKDSLGQKLVGYMDVPMRLTIETNATSGSNGQTQQPPLFAAIPFFLPLVVILVVVIVAVYLYRRRRKSGSL